MLADIFDILYYGLFQQNANLFKWKNDSNLPFSRGGVVVGTLFVYLCSIYVLQKFMQNRQAFKLRIPFIIHNGFLSAVSLVLLLLIAEQLIPVLIKHGLYYAICSAEMMNNPHLELFYYINYLIKYYELIDTMFLVLKKKPLGFLHVYHHSLTVLLCYTQLAGQATVQWVPITLNLIVHVIMYYYYMRTAISTDKIWWKKYLTLFQITQFVIDIAFTYFCLFIGINQKVRILDLNATWTCHGDVIYGSFGAALLTSYLFLFLDFFGKTYTEPVGKKSD